MKLTLEINTKPRGGGPRWWCRKILNSPPPTDTWNQQLRMKQFPEKDLKISWRVPLQQMRKEPHQNGKRGREVVSQKNPPQWCDLQSGGVSHIWSFFLRSGGLCLTWGTLTLGACNGETSTQNVWLWTPMGLTSSRLRTKGSRNPNPSQIEPGGGGQNVQRGSRGKTSSYK